MIYKTLLRKVKIELPLLYIYQ